MQPDPITQKLVTEGLLIEAGFIGMITAMGLQKAPPSQLSAMRDAFFGGATHLLHSIMASLDAETGVTEADERRMANIQAELHAFGDQLARRCATQGRA